MTVPVNEFFQSGLESDAVLDTDASGSSNIKVLFYSEEEAADILGVAYTDSFPIAYAKTSDVSDAVKGDTLTISSTEYNIVDRKNDGEGISLLWLSED